MFKTGPSKSQNWHTERHPDILCLRGFTIRPHCVCVVIRSIPGPLILSNSRAEKGIALNEPVLTISFHNFLNNTVYSNRAFLRRLGVGTVAFKIKHLTWSQSPALRLQLRADRCPGGEISFYAKSVDGRIFNHLLLRIYLLQTAREFSDLDAYNYRVSLTLNASNSPVGTSLF